MKYRNLRILAATGWGAVAMVFILCLLWIFTELSIEWLLFYMIFAYCIAVAIVLLATEPPKKQQRTDKKHNGAKIVTLKKEDWK